MILAIARKELKALFASPLAWIVLAVSQLILGIGFLKQLDDFLGFQAQALRTPGFRGATEAVGLPVFVTCSVLFLLIVPLLGMRLIAEERRNQTMPFLVSSPLSMSDIVIGKFAGLWLFLMALLALATLMPLSLAAGGTIDFGRIAAAFLGLALLGASCAAISLYVSSLTTHPLAAGVGAFCALFGLVLVGETLAEALKASKSPVAAAFVPLAQVFSPFRPLETLLAGSVDTFGVAAPLLLTAFFVALAVRRLDAARLK